MMVTVMFDALVEPDRVMLLPPAKTTCPWATVPELPEVLPPLIPIDIWLSTDADGAEIWIEPAELPTLMMT
jgi:hypothetical protein